MRSRIGKETMNVEEHLGERIGAYLDGELDAPERAALERELDARPELRQLALDLQSVDREARSQEPPIVSSREWAGVLDAVLSRARASSPASALEDPALPLETALESRVIDLRSTRARRGRAAIPVAAAAALVAAVILTAALGIFPTSTPADRDRVAGNPNPTEKRVAELRADDEGAATDDGARDSDEEPIETTPPGDADF